MKTVEEKELARIDTIISQLQEEKNFLFSIVLFNKMKEVLNCGPYKEIYLEIGNKENGFVFGFDENSKKESIYYLFAQHDISMPAGWHVIIDEAVAKNFLICSQTSAEEFLKEFFPPSAVMHLRNKMEEVLEEKKPKKTLKI